MHYQVWPLKECCINYICDNLSEFFYNVDQLEGEATETKLVPKHVDTFFPGRTGEQLLITLCKRGNLTDGAISIFEKNLTHLKTVKIFNSRLTKKGLTILASHNIAELQIEDMIYVSLEDLTHSLGEWTMDNLRWLQVPGISINSTLNIEPLGTLKNLLTLNLSKTKLNSESLGQLTSMLPGIQSLDISQTLVDNLLPLKNLERLKHLNTFNLNLQRPGSNVSVILGLDTLRHLDISIIPTYILSPYVDMNSFLSSSKALTELTSLDISGWWGIDETVLRTFVDEHPQIAFLGLAFTEMDGVFHDVCSPSNGLPITITGSHDLKQTVLTIRHYLTREYYATSALQRLFDHLRVDSENGIDMLTDDVLEVIIQAMDQHPHSEDLLIAATACAEDTSSVYYLGYHRKLASRILTAMEQFETCTQLQFNGLLALSKIALHTEARYDKLRCAKAVLRSLPAHRLYNPLNMGLVLDVIDVITYGFSFDEKLELISEGNGIRILTNVIRHKAGEPPSLDVDLEVVLHILWNLSDECKPICMLILDDLDCLELVCVKSLGEEVDNVNKAMFGMLCNVAEVVEARPALIQESLITSARHLLTNKDQYLSYVAAYFLAQLLSSEQGSWTNPDIASRSTIEQEVEEAILKWEPRSTAIVHYDSLRPFLGMLECPIPVVQLCSIWALHNHCTCTDQHEQGRDYCSMLVHEGGYDVIKRLIADPKTSCHVLEYAKMIDGIISGDSPTS